MMVEEKKNFPSSVQGKLIELILNTRAKRVKKEASKKS